MIAHHSWYARVYRKHNIALMIIFSWMFSYGMQMPTLFNIWGKKHNNIMPNNATCSGNTGRYYKQCVTFIAEVRRYIS